MNRRDLLGLSLAAVGGIFAPRFGRWYRRGSGLVVPYNPEFAAFQRELLRLIADGLHVRFTHHETRWRYVRKGEGFEMERRTRSPFVAIGPPPLRLAPGPSLIRIDW